MDFDKMTGKEIEEWKRENWTDGMNITRNEIIEQIVTEINFNEYDKEKIFKELDEKLKCKPRCIFMSYMPSINTLAFYDNKYLVSEYGKNEFFSIELDECLTSQEIIMRDCGRLIEEIMAEAEDEKKWYQFWK